MFQRLDPPDEEPLMETRPLRRERARMSAAALLTVQMAISAFVPGVGVPASPAAAHPGDPIDPHRRSATGPADRLRGGPAHRTGHAAARLARGRTGAARVATGPVGPVRVPGARFAPIIGADRIDAYSGGYGRAGGLVRLLSMSAKSAAHEQPQRRVRNPLFRSYVRLSHRFVAQRLRAAGIKRRSSGKCASKHRPTCTSYAGIRANTVAKLIRLKRRSGCPVVVTGGTEVGHAPGVHSHGNGYKVDVSRNKCLDAYIKRKARYAGVRSDGARLYADGVDTYALEGNHWDITFR